MTAVRYVVVVAVLLVGCVEPAGMKACSEACAAAKGRMASYSLSNGCVCWHELTDGGPQ